MDSTKLLHTGFIPDSVIRWSIRRRLEKKLAIEHELSKKAHAKKVFLEKLNLSQVAEKTKEANDQHYELPPDFFNHVLGENLKYSCGLWSEGVRDLDSSEKAMLDLYAERAHIKDGQEVLDLGCGWGSLSLYLAEKYPNSKITGVSNSNGQRLWIEGKAKERGLDNLKIITEDMNQLNLTKKFDRILSVEMFEHMRNYSELFKKIFSWLSNDGYLFVHIFCHKEYSYFYDIESDDDWMARYFFSGGTMPSYDLFKSFDQDLKIIDQWKVNGKHYEKTCNEWLKKMDSAQAEIMPLFKETYHSEAKRWWIYWRVFFMACAELFGYENGEEWFVGHYLFKKVC